MEDLPGEARTRGAGMRSLIVWVPICQPTSGQRCCPPVSTTSWRGLLYYCPQGQPLTPRKIKYTEEEVVYRADAATCNACLVKAECTASDRGRIVHRTFYADYLNTVRG